MVCPETLALAGNAAGRIGPAFAGALAAAGILHGLTAWNLGRTGDAIGRRASPEEVLEAGLGGAWTGVLLAARWTLTAGLATGVCAGAGFAFNEIFYHAFPNFAFAALIPAGLGLLRIRGRDLAERIQVGAVAIALAGLLVLVAWALLLPDAFAPGETAQTTPATGIRTCLLALTALAGFELALEPGEGNRPEAFRAMVFALAIGALVLIAWTWMAAAVVPASKLAASTLPHLLAARRIAGPPGRTIMGLVIISGSVAVVNALMAGASGTLRRMSRRGLLPKGYLSEATRVRIFEGFSAAWILGWLVSGMAGSPNLEVLIRAGWILWLFHYGILHLAAYRIQKTTVEGGRPPGLTLSAAAAAGYAVSSLALVVLDPSPWKVAAAAIAPALLAVPAVRGYIRSGRGGERVSSASP
ncbi:Amino acid transporter [Desulfacinum infernum DSM 9756]|uniref:Amino acid transporter n=2 Tax=Desulfacinum infernum TaxID=35837 RepID=A0A1M5AH07_9BACT|nr:Amino acid transporter [Desulfacinum infernum DSM 9756]